MGDNLRFFSSASPDSSHGHGHTPDGHGPGFAGPWIEPGAYSDYGPEDYAARAEDELQRLISTDGPTSSWLYSDYYADSQPDAHAPTTGPAPIQRELTVGSINDPLEEEADAVAERVMRNPRDFYLDPRVSSFQPYQIGGRGEQVVAHLARMAQEEEAAQLKAEAPEISRMGEQDKDEEMQYKFLQRNLAGMDEDAKETLGYTHAFEKSDEDEDMGTTTSMYLKRESAASPEGGTVSPELQRRIDGVRISGGEKLPESELEFFESRMGHDFGNVRVHTGSEAVQVSRDVNAKAFTIGRDVVFGEGEYKPGTSEGRRLMAHELTHTMQQAGVRALQKITGQADKLSRSPIQQEKPRVKLPALKTATEAVNSAEFVIDIVNNVLADPKHIEAIQFEAYGGSILRNDGKPHQHQTEYEQAIRSAEKKIEVLRKFQKTATWKTLSTKDRQLIVTTVKRGRNILRAASGLFSWTKSVAQKYRAAGVRLPFEGEKFKSKSGTRTIDKFKERVKGSVGTNVSYESMGLRALKVLGFAGTAHAIYLAQTDPEANTGDMIWAMWPWSDGKMGYQRAVEYNIQVLQDNRRALNERS